MHVETPETYDDVPRARRPRRTWPQRLLIVFNVSFALALLATAGGLAYVYTKYSRLPRVELGSSLDAPTSGGEPRNVLIVGVDSAAGLDPSDPVRATRNAGGMRSDTMMILRIEPGSKRASLLSLPRDLWVPIAGTGGSQRINVAVNEGGPERLIATIQEYFNVPIHHYVQVDFAGFQELVEAIDGVPMYFPTPVRDTHSGLQVTTAGCVTLSPPQALAYVRSRAYQFYERGRWRTDPTGDLGRISRQQDFIRRAVRRAIARGVRNPVTLDRLLDVALRSVAVDDTLTARDILQIGERFRAFNPERLTMYSLPVSSDSVGGASVLRLVDSVAQPILDRFRGGPPGEVTPSGIRVRVLNGSGRSGEAGSALADLVDAGFGGAGAGEAESFAFERTVVRFAPGGRAGATLVARWLVAGADLEEVEGLVGGDVVVVTGDDYVGVRAGVGPSSLARVAPLTTSSSTTSSSVSSTTSSTSSTTTTIVGEVPAAPDGATCDPSPPGRRAGAARRHRARIAAP